MGIRFTALKKIAAGFFTGAAAMIWAAGNLLPSYHFSAHQTTMQSFSTISTRYTILFCLSDMHSQGNHVNIIDQPMPLLCGNLPR
jgi:hypothetical protein